MTALAVFVLAVGLLVGAVLAQPRHEAPTDSRRTPAAGAPGGEVVAQGSPTPIPTSAPTAAPSPNALPRRTSRPSATTVPTTQPAVVAVAVAAPADTVADFYRDVAAGEFDAAYALWSDRMKATYPREGNLDERFDHTASITFQALYVAEQHANNATVQTNFTETYDSGASRQFIGYWRLIRTERRWLLDEPHY